MRARLTEEKNTAFFIFGLLTAVGVVACSATVFGFFGRFFWLLDLFTHFRVQYLIALTLLSTLFLVARRWKTAGVFLVFAALNLSLLLPMYCGGQNTAPEKGRRLRVMLLNVNRELGDPKRVTKVIQEADPDILVLEEISSKWLADMAWLSRAYPHVVTRPREDNFGIGLFSKFSFAQSRIVSPGSLELPTILATVRTGRADLRVIATHPMPPLGQGLSRLRNEQLDLLPQYVSSSLPLILLGDLNVTPWSAHFKRLLKRSRLMNSMRGFGVQATWPSSNPILKIPVDHCLHSPDIVVLNREIGPYAGSDHLPLIVDLLLTRR